MLGCFAHKISTDEVEKKKKEKGGEPDKQVGPLEETPAKRKRKKKGTAQ